MVMSFLFSEWDKHYYFPDFPRFLGFKNGPNKNIVKLISFWRGFLG